ncbi:hypothetical protein ACHAPT_009894 [Fusarium lateritium]
MASTEAETATVSVEDIAAMSDAELDQFMTKHRGPDGDYSLPIDGLGKLSKDERDRLAERLRAQERSLAQSPTACSRPLDLDDLDARLRQNGGRPLYPIGLIRDIYRDPDNYAELLWPWQVNLSPVSPSGIFQKQLQRWQDFRKWQNDNRGLEDDDGGYPAYVERRKFNIQRRLMPKAAAKRLAQIEADPSCLQSAWEDLQWERDRQRYDCRERGCKGFHDYAKAVRRRHNFTQPFELDENPKTQDKLTTWIEYLNYEYWWLDKHTSDLKRLEPDHEKAWQELVDTGILRPHETKEFVRTAASAIEHENEKERAQGAVERTKCEAKRIYVLAQEHEDRLRIPHAKRISMMKVATEELLAARRWLEQAQRRSDLVTQFVRATFDYKDAKRDAARHRVLVRWVLDQVPLIEAEVSKSNANRPKSSGRWRTKRKLTTDQEFLERPPPKRVEFDLQEPRSAGEKAPSTATATQPDPSMVMDQGAAQGSRPEDFSASYSHWDGVEAMSQGSRSCACIAAH